MRYFNFKDRNFSSGPHIIGLIFIPVGIVMLVSPFIMDSINATTATISIGVVAIALGVLILSSFNGTLIDFTTYKYKEYFSCCGVKFGDWVPLTTITEIKLLTRRFTQTNTPNGISRTLSGSVTEYKVLLQTHQDQNVLSFKYYKQKQAGKAGEQLSRGLNVPLNL